MYEHNSTWYYNYLLIVISCYIFRVNYHITDIYNVALLNAVLVYVCCRITTQARSLLRLIPTDPSVVEALDSISQKVRFCIIHPGAILITNMLEYLSVCCWIMNSEVW